MFNPKFRKKIEIFEPNQDLKLLQKENHLVKIIAFLLCGPYVGFMLVLSYFLKIIAGFELYQAPQENNSWARRFVPRLSSYLVCPRPLGGEGKKEELSLEFWLRKSVSRENYF